MKKTVKALLSLLIVFAMVFGVVIANEGLSAKAMSYHPQFTKHPGTCYSTETTKSVSWELNFTPSKYEFLRNGTVYAVIENPVNSYYSFAAGNYSYTVRAYYGSGTGYITSQSFKVNKVDFIIDSILLYSDWSEPAEGRAPYMPRLVSVNGSSDLNELIDTNMSYSEWYYNDEYSTSSESYRKYYGDVFEAGFAYDLYCYFQVNGNGVFSEDCTLTLNTPDGTITGTVVPGANTTSISYDFFFDVIKHKVTSIELKTDTSAPVAGETLYYPTVYSVNGNKSLASLVKNGSIRWYSSDDGNLYGDYSGDVFEGGKYYQLFCDMYLEEKAEFDSNCTITLTTSNEVIEGSLFYKWNKDNYGFDINFDQTPFTLKIKTQPVNTSAANGEAVKVTVEAEGDGVTYQWYLKNKGDTKYSKSSITSNVYQTTMSAEKDGRILQCVIKDKYGNMVKSDVVTITMKNPLKITQQPVSASAANGESVKVTVKATGDGVTYQWWVKNPGDEVYTKSSITSNVYQTNMTAAKDGRILRCVIKDKYGNMVKSDIVTITMLKQTPLKITQQPVNTTAANGETVKVTVKAEGDGVTYQWYIKNKGDSKYTKSSITSNTYSAVMNESRDGRILQCVIKDKYGNMVKSDVVTITMKTPLKITQQPVSASAANGEIVKVTVKAQGDGVTYQWWIKNPGDEVYTKSSITSNVYQTNMTAAKDGRILRCVIKDKYGNMVKSDIVTITMK